MKKYLLFLVLLSTSVAYAQKSIKGQVIDEKTKEVLPGVSVYINNSTIGTITDAEGKFELIVPFTGKMELVASHVIYKKKNILIESGNYDQLQIAMEAQDNTLKEVIIKAKRNKDDNFKKWGDLFTRIIIGNNPRFANNCKITNVKELVFYFDKDINELSVYAKSPLIIENELLNYRIKIDLENFNYNFGNDVLRLNYSTFFEDLSKNKEKLSRVKALRDEAYFGSQMHFMRSVYNNKLTMDGFSIYHYRSIKNAEKERINKVVQNKIGDRFSVKNNPNFDLRSLFPTMDTVNYYKMVLKQDDVLAIDTIRTQSRKLAVLNRQLGTVKFEFSDTLMVKYQPLLDARFPKAIGGHGPSTAVQYSFMYPVEKGGINIERNGYYPELILFIYGNMSERRISQLLPWDYDPDKN